jgi:hypothetical protein
MTMKEYYQVDLGFGRRAKTTDEGQLEFVWWSDGPINCYSSTKKYSGIIYRFIVKTLKPS